MPDQATTAPGDGDSPVDRIIELLEMQLNTSGSIQAARSFAIRQRNPEALVDEAIRILAARRRLFEDREPAPIADDTRLQWYHGLTGLNARCWRDYVARLRALGWTDAMVETLDATTSRALGLLDPPGNAAFATRGLVFGRVQSGKTAHFAGVIAKAADCGYRLVIVLSGVTNGLRLQTQKRLDRDLSGDDNARWFWLTRREIFGDFETLPVRNVDFCLGGAGGARAIAVVKKQSNVLRRLIDWLGQGSEMLRRSCPVLVIDDEADQASINSGRSMDRDELTRINGLIVDLVSGFPKCAYVGYTATPFANVLTHPDYPENLYPRSFIFPLDPPPDYFGTARIHGRARLNPSEPDEVTDGLPLIREIPLAEIGSLRPATRAMAGFRFEATPSLVDALRYFFLATAARLFRAAIGSRAMDFSTMLIHTSHRVAVHTASEPVIRAAIDALRREVRAREFGPWQSQWAQEMAAIDRRKLDARLGEVDFDDLRDHLFPALDRVRIVVSNSLRDEESNVVFEERGQILVVIGGNTLARGLTLEGLVVSFFARSANAYDTILQMGRWFGYRHYYEDLPRIWMTAEMADHFFDLATVEDELREQIETHRARGLSPMQAAVRIRRLPRIKVTAPSKMRFAVRGEISYEGARPQTIYFAHRDPGWVAGNLDATRRLLGALPAPAIADSRAIWRRVPVDRILSFLRAYRFHPRSRDLDSALMCDYITRQNGVGRLQTWNVVVMGRSSAIPELGTVRLRPDLEVACINRSRLKLGDPATANIKALMSRVDIVCDRPEFNPAALENLKVKDLFDLRGDDPSGVLVIYPVSKDSRPRETGESTERAPMAAHDNLIGIAMIFPGLRGGLGAADYVQADLQPQPSTESDEPEVDPTEATA
ncbi:MAG: hypothetical protein KF715_19890 [Candidatus Didemnitutus sp.]|nr:hypothetical protein [Candidatus Didemnitutus sp.]